MGNDIKGFENKKSLGIYRCSKDENDFGSLLVKLLSIEVISSIPDFRLVRGMAISQFRNACPQVWRQNRHTCLTKHSLSRI